MGKHMRVWALPASHPPLPGLPTAAQPPVLQLQPILSTTLALDTSSDTSVIRNGAPRRLTAMLHWHRQPAAFQVWLQTGDLAILSALHHPLVKSDQSLGPATRVASARQTAADARTTSQNCCYKGHQVRPFRHLTEGLCSLCSTINPLL